MEIPSIFLNRILAKTAKDKASTMILTVGSLPAFRVDNHLHIMEDESMLTVEIIEKLIGFILDADEKKLLADEKEVVVVKIFGGDFRFRVNVFYQKGLPALSFHYIPAAPKKLTDLRFPEILNNLIMCRSGLIIIAGSKFSGKTTIAASIIEEVNINKRRHIATIEDPIEYLFVNKRSIIEQRQVGRDVKSVVKGLHHCLEEDVDIVYLGEIRKELAEVLPLIFELASGNSLVVLEINSNSAVRTVEKILNSFDNNQTESARYNLADVLVGITVHKLVNRVGGGIILVSEVLLANAAVKSLIREGKIYQLESVMQTSRREGMISMDKAIEELIEAGEIKPEEAGQVI
ncbi:hypothetical protein COS18_05475 [Candidatus Falkowbacteria bacterium CG02_land_8_20_14_3_00_36_14]|uniref:Bacterial type II secretion system protein E domain-containing protein n=1 Tax=Candidatus Falkowbacteria bacterium CG02_land_8_20_14_3_00_36_14 TaxID=1974560 RepID=A0A2M7DKH9_9BACT|nr:MAG: hypothetical protein COS18_05475 [Candidatus Falkowbacteria bacterium CG02_land_8_20_14_3_00_36_14]